MAASRRLAVVIGLVGGITLSLLAAQEPVFRASVETVTIDVSVTRGNSAVTGLTARHFSVRDNGVPQVVERVMRDEVPLHLMLVFDTSGSLGDTGVRVLADAAGALLDSLKADDHVGLVTFSELVDVRVPPTLQHDQVRAALRGGTSSGPTAWRDALFVATQLLEPRADARRVVLLLSDGKDTSSWMPPQDIDDVVRRSGIVLHAIEHGTSPLSRFAGDPREPFNGPGSRTGSATSTSAATTPALPAAVAAGGGRVWLATSDRLKERFLEVLDELRSRYLLSYVPIRPATAGWHDVSVTLVDTRGDVRARPGYWVPSGR